MGRRVPTGTMPRLPGSEVLDVTDVAGQVVGVPDLVGRITELLGELEASEVLDDSGAPTAVDGERSALLGEMERLVGEVGPRPVPGKPGAPGQAVRLARRAAWKVLRPVLEPRLEAQRDFDERTWRFAAGRNHDFVQLRAQVEELQRSELAARLRLAAALGQVAALQGVVDRVEAAVAAAARRTERRRPEAVDGAGAGAPAVPEIDYVAFEDRFRGDPEQIRRSQQRYLQLLPPGGRVLDVGCGRGEMLQLLRAGGWEATGVDLDEGMVEACRAKGLDAVVGDALDHLGSLPDESLAGITAMQVVEHLSTPDLEQLLVLARSKLAAGGALVIETINPRSWFALSNHFYADLSHTRPVHPETLRFLCEQLGYSQVAMELRAPHPELAGLAERSELDPAIAPLVDAVFGHQDYVLVANR